MYNIYICIHIYIGGYHMYNPGTGNPHHEIIVRLGLPLINHYISNHYSQPLTNQLAKQQQFN